MAPKQSFEELPIHPENWPPEPTTQAAFDEWLVQTDSALRKWLLVARDQAHNDQRVEKLVKTGNARAARTWNIHEPNTDIQTGTIDKRGLNNGMRDAMEALKEESRKLHNEHYTWFAHLQRMHAESAWEDFLYYQNVWNRKNFDSSLDFYETKQERDYRESKDKKKKKKKQKKNTESLATETTAAGADDGCAAPGDEDATGPKKNGASLYKPATLKEIEIPKNPGGSDSVMEELHTQWLDHMIKLYTRFKLAYRKQMPEYIDPVNAHRYSQPPRGTHHPENASQLARHEHLRIRFPRQKRKRAEGSNEGDEVEIEENYPTQEEIEKDKQYDARGLMEPITWRMDEGAVKKLVQKNEAKRNEETKQRKRKISVKNAENTRGLLPSGHTTYHDSQATSFGWPTSFDSKNWDSNIAITSNKKAYVYEPESDAKKVKKVSLERRRDERGRFRKIETRSRYVMVESEKSRTVTVFRHALNPDGTVQGRDLHGNWLGEKERRQVKGKEFARNGRAPRPELPPRFLFKRQFQVHVKGVVELSGTRQTRHDDDDKRAQLTDDEEEDCSRSNKHFKWSGNTNSDQVVKGPDTIANEGDEEESDGQSEEQGEESTDEGDLFKQAYDECSGNGECPTQRRARELHARLVAGIGVLSWWDESRTLALCKNKKTDEAIWEQYALLMRERERPI